MVTKKCVFCGEKFIVHDYRRNTAKYCSFSCGGKKHHDALSCQKCYFKRNVGENHCNFKGGQNNNGYLMVKTSNHPFADHRGYVHKHRLIAEKFLNRYLTSKEVVHHINRNRRDNRPENLYVFPSQREHIKVGHYGKPLTSNLL